MTPSESANLTRHRGQPGFYEIWFIVFFEKDARRATWLRYTTFASTDGTSRRATLWAASFDGARGERAIATKTILGFDQFTTKEDRFDIAIGDAVLTQGAVRGSCASGGHRIAWDLTFDPREHPAARTPSIAHRLPLAVDSAHANTDVAFHGWVEVDGARRSMENAVGTQVHIWGTRRVDELAWIYIPGLVEVTHARPKSGMPAVTSVWLDVPEHGADLTQLPGALAQDLEVVAPGIVDVHARGTRIRAYCDPAEMVGYVYRDPGGKDLYIAQSDIASCEIERFDRRGLGVRPLQRWSRFESAALEIHGPEPLPGVAYIPWVGTTAEVVVPAPRARSIPAPTSGTMTGTEDPRAIVAFGLTYRGHIEETGSKAEVVAFTKDVRAWFAEGDRISAPDTNEILAAIEPIEPELADDLRKRYGFFPAILDYEVELAMMVLDASEERVGWFVANDITARSVQVLAEGRPDPLPYWSAAKSFRGFLPVSPKMWIPEKPGVVPDVTLTTTVNGAVRQRASSRDLMLSPSDMLARAKVVLGRDLARGDVILTGTPSGIGFEVGRAKRWLGSKLLDRLGRLEAAFAMHTKSAKLLRPGDRVEVDAGFLGRRSVEIALD